MMCSHHWDSFSSNCPSNEKHSTELKDSSLIWNNWRFFLNNKFILHNYPTTFPPGPRLHPVRSTYQGTQTASLATGEAFSWVHSTAHPLIARFFGVGEWREKKKHTSRKYILIYPLASNNSWKSFSAVFNGTRYWEVWWACPDMCVYQKLVLCDILDMESRSQPQMHLGFREVWMQLILLTISPLSFGKLSPKPSRVWLKISKDPLSESNSYET